MTMNSSKDADEIVGEDLIIKVGRVPYDAKLMAHERLLQSNLSQRPPKGNTKRGRCRQVGVGGHFKPI